MALVIYRIDAVDGAKIDNLTSPRCDLLPDAILGGTQRAAATLHLLFELQNPAGGTLWPRLSLLPTMASARSRSHRRSDRPVVRTTALWTGASNWRGAFRAKLASLAVVSPAFRAFIVKYPIRRAALL